MVNNFRPVSAAYYIPIWIYIVGILGLIAILLLNYFFVYEPVSKIKISVDNTARSLNEIIDRTNKIEDTLENEFKKARCALCHSSLIPASIKAELNLCDGCPSSNIPPVQLIGPGN